MTQTLDKRSFEVKVINLGLIFAGKRGFQKKEFAIFYGTAVCGNGKEVLKRDVYVCSVQYICTIIPYPIHYTFIRMLRVVAYKALA